MPAANLKNGRFAHIDALRAFAVLLVVVSHAGLGHIVPGGSGVTIFFAISGFIITHLVLREDTKTGRFDIAQFYIRRLLKLAPPFIVIVLVPTVVYSFWHPIDYRDVLSQTFFAFNWLNIDGGHQVLPGSAVVWSLAIEEQFYIAFALLWLMLIGTRRRLLWLGLTAVGISLAALGIRIFIVVNDFSHDRIYYGTDTRMDGIAIGVLAAIVYFAIDLKPAKLSGVKRVLESDWILAVAVITYVGSLVYRDPFFRETLRYTIQAISASMLALYGMGASESPVRAWLMRVACMRVVQMIGLSSYSIYLVHLSWNAIWASYIYRWPTLVSALFQVVTGVLVGIVAWLLIEKPAERYKQRLGELHNGCAEAPFTKASTSSS